MEDDSVEKRRYLRNGERLLEAFFNTRRPGMQQLNQWDRTRSFGKLYNDIAFAFISALRFVHEPNGREVAKKLQEKFAPVAWTYMARYQKLTGDTEAILLEQFGFGVRDGGSCGASEEKTAQGPESVAVPMAKFSPEDSLVRSGEDRTDTRVTTQTMDVQSWVDDVQRGDAQTTNLDRSAAFQAISGLRRPIPVMARFR